MCRSYDDDLRIRRCRAQSNNVTPVNIYDDSLLIIFLILLSVALVICVLELSSKQHRPRREKTCLLGFQQSEFLTASLRLDRLARNLNFSRSKCRYDSSKKTDNKVADETARVRRLICTFIVTNHRRQVFAVAVHLLSTNA